MIIGMKVINFKTDVPAWSPTGVYVPGEMVQFEENIYRCTHKTKQRPLQTVNGIITWKRVYDDFVFSSTYNKDDIVEYLGSIYKSLNDNNSSNTDNRQEWIRTGVIGYEVYQPPAPTVVCSEPSAEDLEAFDAQMKAR